jgi:hypothetical protein
MGSAFFVSVLLFLALWAFWDVLPGSGLPGGLPGVCWGTRACRAGDGSCRLRAARAVLLGPCLGVSGSLEPRPGAGRPEARFVLFVT